MDNSNQLILGDCLKEMANLPDNSFDLAIVDPPYNTSKGNNWEWKNSISLPGLGGDWQKVNQNWDDMSFEDYFQFSAAWIEQVKRLVKPTGSIWIHGTYHNIGVVNIILQMLNVEIINEIAWFKRNSFPNLSGRRLTASHETILWAHTGGKKREYLFNYDFSKEASFPEDTIKKAGKQMRTVWDIPNNKKRHELAFGKHPTQKPIRLAKRMIELSSKEGGRCLVPFVGSGTECVAAIETGRKFTGFEKEQEYYEIAKKRIEDAEQQPAKLL